MKVKKDDDIKSKEQWIGFLKRNQSVLVDMLYGQYKSTLYCPDTQCQNISTTFDPFLSVSLPLSSKNENYEITCYFLFYKLDITPIQLTIPFHIETTIMAMRNKIAKFLNVHPFSFFVVKMDYQGNLDQIANSSMLIRTLSVRSSKNTSPFFCFQIEPELFLSPANNLLSNLERYENRNFEDTLEMLEKSEEEKKKLCVEDYEEEEVGITKEDICYYSKFLPPGDTESRIMKINTDNNNGLSNNFIRIVILMRRYEQSHNYSYTIRRRLIFPRVIFVDKRWSTKKVHEHIASLFAPLLKKHHNLNSEDVWNTFFPDYAEAIANKTAISQQEHKEKSFPYVIRIKGLSDPENSLCLYCGVKDCSDCLLPYSDTITIQDLLNKIPKNEDGLEIDNSFYYLNDKQRSNINYKEKDLEIECTWLDQYHSEVKNLNNKKDFEFKARKSYKEESICIEKCFKNFVKLEKLEENNEWFCPQCKTHQKAEKKMEIFKSPHILIIHLKRFRAGGNGKIDSVVDFPIDGLDISNYVIHKEEGVGMVYDLFAIANHYGGLGGGHYVAYAKNSYDKQWYEFNDSTVRKISESNLISSGAYVLFYRRRNLSEFLNLENVYNKTFEDYDCQSNIVNGSALTNIGITTKKDEGDNMVVDS